MARKKKTEEVKTISQPTKVEGTQNISYAGTVNIKVQRGKRTLMTKKYNNKGMTSLFKFLCLALAGSYSDDLRPCKIKLFCYDKANEINNSPADFNWNTIFNNLVEDRINNYGLKDASSFIVFDATPLINKKDNSYEVTFHFRVPGSLISSDMVHMIGLFPNNVYSGNEKEVSAYYLFTEVDASTKKTIWAPLELGEDKISGNYSLIIDWTMSIANKGDGSSTITTSPAN